MDVGCVRMVGGGLQWCIIRFRPEDLLQLAPVPLQFPQQKVLNVGVIQSLLGFNLRVCRIGCNHAIKILRITVLLPQHPADTPYNRLSERHRVSDRSH